MRVLVLGATGMLGWVVTRVMADTPKAEVSATSRDGAPGYVDVPYYPLDAENWRTVEASLNALPTVDWIINCIGIIKPYIKDDKMADVERATAVNASFPHHLAHWSAKTGARVIQIATDCVYSGAKGRYLEKDAHDALDVYGKTKSLGEVKADNFHHLRCSIIGPERKGHLSLLDWFRKQPEKAGLSGFTNHRWNGVTTLHYAKLCAGIITRNVMLGSSQHVLPADDVSKYELLKLFAENFNRRDVTVGATEAKVFVDRTLATESPALNQALWQAAGYEGAPATMAQMITELAEFCKRHSV